MKTLSSPPRNAASVRFRREIEKADAAGVPRDAMTLHLTLGDVSQLRRDRSLAVEDISFVGGVMRFLGVKIQEGGVAESVLALPEHGEA